VTWVHGEFDGLGRFADPSLLILTSLADGPKHGYAIMTDIAAFSGITMEPGTLYGALSRLERRGWIRPLATGERRRPYAIAAAWPSRAGQGDAAVKAQSRVIPPGGGRSGDR
jgi:Transcriptional regulator PadR-like family